MAILFKLLTKYAKQILFRYGESSHFTWEQPKGSRHSEWIMGLEINISAAGPLSPISGGARGILSSQTGLLPPLPPISGWRPRSLQLCPQFISPSRESENRCLQFGNGCADLEFPQPNRLTPPSATNSASTPFRRTTTRRPRHQLRRNKHRRRNEI